MATLDIPQLAEIYITHLQTSQRRVFDILQGIARNHAYVFPSLETLAKKSGYCVRTVQKALKKLAELGFVGWVKRPYQSNLYFIPDDLIYVDFHNVVKHGHKPKPPEDNPPECHVLKNSPNVDNSTIGGVVSKSGDGQKKKAVHIHEFLKIRCLEEKERFSLAKNFPEVDLVGAINDVKWYHRQGKKIKSYFAMIWAMAKRRFTKRTATYATA